MDITKGQLAAILGGGIYVRRCLIDITGSLSAGALLSQAVYWQQVADKSPERYPDGWWYKTVSEWTEETGMGEDQLTRARKHCKGLLRYEVRGMPAKTFYKVDWEALLSRIPNMFPGNRQSSLAETAEQEPGKPPIHIHNTTSENTIREGKGRHLDNGHHQPPSNISPSQLILWEKSLERIEKRIEVIKGQCSADAWGLHPDGKQGTELKRLRAERKELKSKLGFIV